MYKLLSSSKFERKLRKLYKKDKKTYSIARDKIKILVEDPFQRELKTHVVILKDIGKCYSTRITGDIRILWILHKDSIILIMDIGGHSGNRSVY